MVLEFERDCELMLSVCNGDTASFAALLDAYRAPIVYHLYRMVHNEAIAEELAQDVFVRVYRCRRYEPSAKFRTWLFRIATNVALNYHRDERHRKAELSLDYVSAQSRALDPPDRQLNAEEYLVRDSDAVEIRAAIKALPVKQRAAVLMHKYESMEYTEIAEALETTVPAVKSLLFRAYSSLRTALAHLEPAEA